MTRATELDPTVASRMRETLGAQWRRDPKLIIWATVLVVIVLIVVIGPLVLVSPTATDPGIRLQGPSLSHWFGTDDFGRDILSRVVSGGQVSLGLGAIVTIVSIALGTFIGMVAGFYRPPSAVLMRFMDALLAFPAIVLAIALVVALGSQNGVLSESIALTVVFTPYVARVVRSRTLAIAQRGFITAARASGVHSAKILIVHVLPNALPATLIQATYIYASVLLADASLSFLVLGVAPPTPTWGNMIAEAKPYINRAPFFIIAPGAAIVIAVMAFNLAGDSIRSLIDPRAKAVLSLQALQRARASKAAKKKVLVARQATTTPGMEH